MEVCHNDTAPNDGTNTEYLPILIFRALIHRLNNRK